MSIYETLENQSYQKQVRRDHFAGLAMQGLLAKHGEDGTPWKIFVQWFVELADAMIDALDSTKETTK